VHDNALELWADFFGAKILFTLFLHDNFFKSHYSFFETPEILISNYYSGLCCVYEYYYSNANIRYPSKEFRIQIGLASITSVFSYFENNLRNKYSVIAVKVFSENENFDKGSYTATQSEMKVIFPQIMEIHRLIQGKDAFISKDMKEEYLNYITTAYI
jgi:hypothetical protein